MPTSAAVGLPAMLLRLTFSRQAAPPPNDCVRIARPCAPRPHPCRHARPVPSRPIPSRSVPPHRCLYSAQTSHPVPVALLSLGHDTALCHESPYSARPIHISAHCLPGTFLDFGRFFARATYPTLSRPPTLLTTVFHTLDPALSRIGRNLYLHTLPPHPFFAPPHDYGHRHTPRSPHCCSPSVILLAWASHRYLHGSATVLSTCPSPPSSPASPSLIFDAPTAALARWQQSDRSTAFRRLCAPHRQCTDPVQLAPPSTYHYTLQRCSLALHMEKQGKDEGHNVDVVVLRTSSRIHLYLHTSFISELDVFRRFV
ncbi:hypothetical protein B0H14DRAFT_3508097 [Mycena olivaceomarginata]|nr:hypothetical protein B0H14DRAFT_3508097 [Mycena olivaceomarginata]